MILTLVPRILICHQDFDIGDQTFCLLIRVLTLGPKSLYQNWDWYWYWGALGGRDTQWPIFTRPVVQRPVLIDGQYWYMASIDYVDGLVLANIKRSIFDRWPVLILKPSISKSKSISVWLWLKNGPVWLWSPFKPLLILRYWYIYIDIGGDFDFDFERMDQFDFD